MWTGGGKFLVCLYLGAAGFAAILTVILTH